MSINTELNLLKDTKENLRTAIMEKGVVVSSSDLFSTYPTRISQISAQSGTYDESLKKLLDGSYTSYEIPNGTEKLKRDAFHSYTSLTAITIPPTIKTINPYVFYGCTSLNRVNITDLSAWCGIDFKTSGSDISSNPLSTANRLYMNGTQITNLVIPSDVTEIKPYVFFSASGFTSVVIPDSVTSIGNNAFNGCSSLTSVTVNATTPPSLGSHALDDTNNCPIYVPEDSVETYKTAWRTYADRIQAIPVPNKMIITYDNGGIIETISIPEDHICDGEEMSYPTTIRDCDFYELYESQHPSTFRTITIGENVEIIEYTSGGCIGLESITVEATTPPEIYGDVFNSAETNYCPIYVPADSLQVYLDDPNWGMYYSSRLQAITEVKFFRRIQYIQDVTSGKYLIVDTAKNIALNASLIASTASTYDGINANDNYISVDIDTAVDTIEATETTLNAAVDYDGNYLTWTDENSGIVYYLSPNTSGSNFKPNGSSPSGNVAPYATNINDGLTFKASNVTKAIALYTRTSNSKFRWQATNTSSNFINVRLFKLDE